mgnify:CR=1 FL=1
MQAMKAYPGIRQNPAGDWPKIDGSSFVDPSAQIMGNVQIGPNVYVGPLSVIRADEVDAQGKVQPVIIEEGSLIQDGVIIHARGGTVVRIGPRANIAHGVIIHGPCEVRQDCFVALRAAIYSSTLEEGVWVGIGSIIMRTTVPSHTMIPAGSVLRSNDDLRAFRITNVKEEDYKRDVFGASTILRESYKKLYGSVTA